MSRVGKKPIILPDGVSVNVSDDGVVSIQGPLGKLSQSLDPAISLKLDGKVVGLESQTDQSKHKSLHGLYRSLINNMVIGVSVGYVKDLDLFGVGYKASVQGSLLELSLGYSHGIAFILPSEVTAVIEMSKDKNPMIRLKCIDKQLIGQVAAKIKSLRCSNPYTGQGIKGANEVIRRKVRKSTGGKK